MPEHKSNASQTGNSISESMLLAGLVTVMTLAAAAVYPIWDDRRLLLLIDKNGTDAIQRSFGFRPVIAYVISFLIDHRILLPTALAFHWLGWVGIGLVTMRLWRLMFPAHAKFALLPALLSVTPVLCKVQLVAFTVVFICLVPPVLAYVGIFLLLSADAFKSLKRRLIFSVIGLGLVALATIMSEYGTLTAVVGVVLLIAKAIRGGKKQRRQSLILASLSAACAVSSYLIFLRIGTGSNPGFLPGYSLQFFSWKIKIIPFRLLSGLWRGVIGAFLERLGSITIASKPALLSFVVGAVFSAMVFFVVRKKPAGGFEMSRDTYSVVTLLVAAAAIQVPILLMDRTLESKWDSRFYLPLLPVLSSLTVFILLGVLRRRLWLAVPVLCGFLAGYWTTSEIAATWRNRESARIERQDNAPKHFVSYTPSMSNATYGRQSKQC